VARVTVSRGQGRGALGILRFVPPPEAKTDCAPLRERSGSEQLDGIISMHLIESDPTLSKPITDDPSAPNPGAGDWFVLIDGTHVNAISAAIAARFSGSAFEQGIRISAGSYNLMWDLARSDLQKS
jgi:hypothetical protein